MQLFFPLHRSFSTSLSPRSNFSVFPLRAYNASYHMVAENSWRCRGAFIGASKHSCNNAHQGSEFFITLMLDRGDPPAPPLPPKPTQLLSPSLNTKPQIGWDSLLERGNHKPHSANDVMCWRDARFTRQQASKATMFLCFQVQAFLKFALSLAVKCFVFLVSC